MVIVAVWAIAVLQVSAGLMDFHALGTELALGEVGALSYTKEDSQLSGIYLFWAPLFYERQAFECCHLSTY